MTEPWTLAGGDVLGGYRVVRPLGRGGMGEVYLVENVEMGKRYALKLLPSYLADDARFHERFRREARVMADLDHPGAVRVHHMASEGGRYFLVMDYVEGPRGGGGPRTLADEIRERGRLPSDEAKRLAIEIADALSAAHGAGVLHMDLKPGNVLLDRDGRARLTDFGLARILGPGAGEGARPAGDAAELSIADTRAGPLADRPGKGAVGTSGYMSPEQERGEKLDERSDIFSLGVVIYCMLMGRRPVALPAMPSEKGLPERWDDIIRGCLADDPDARFGSAGDVAARLRGLDGPAAHAAAGGGRGGPELFEFPPLGEEGRGGPRAGEAPPPAPLPEGGRGRPTDSPPAGGARRRRRRCMKCAVVFALAALVAGVFLRGPRSIVLEGHKAAVTSVAFSPDGDLLATGSADGTAVLWSLAGHAGYASPPRGGSAVDLALRGASADGQGVGDAGPARDGTLPRQVVERSRLRSGEGGVTSLAFSPDGMLLAAANEYHTATIWEVASGEKRATLKGHEAAVTSVAFSPPCLSTDRSSDGLVTVSADGTFALWSARTGAKVVSSKIAGSGSSVAYSPDGRRFVVGQTDIGFFGGKGRLTCHDAAGGEELMTFGAEHEDRALAVAFSPDGRYLAAAETDPGIIRTEHFVRLYDVASGRELRRFARHRGEIRCVAFSPDGRLLATAGGDRIAAVWEVTSGALLLKLGGLLSGHRGAVRAVAFSPDGNLLATAGDDETARIWLLPALVLPEWATENTEDTEGDGRNHK